MTARGRPALGHTSTIQIGIGPRLDKTLRSLSRMSSVSRASIIRAALTAHLLERGALIRGDREDVTPTRIRKES